MQRNIKILYLLSFLNNLWFWMGIWALYYLLFTNFTGIGIIETAMILTIMVFEIPSGAFADIFGKKKTLVLAFIVIATANALMGFATGFSTLLMSSVFIAVGSTMISGTFEAITYDSLRALKKESLYDKILGRQKSFVYIALASSTILGGLMYTYIHPRAPFFAVAIVIGVACILALFLKEPPTDVKKVSLGGYGKQLKQGFLQLFANVKVRPIVIMFLIVMIVPLFMYEMLSDLLLVTYEATAMEISIGIFIIYTAVSVVVHFTATISEKFGSLRTFVVLFFIYATLLLLVPFINFAIAIMLISVLASINAINQVIQSKIINQKVPSKYRATTLSTFTMLVSIPYVLVATLLGYFADKYTVQNVIFVLGAFMIFALVVTLSKVLSSIKKL